MRTQKEALDEILEIVAEIVEISGPVGIPSGHLYAMICDKFSLAEYQGLVKILVLKNRITDTGHLLQAKLAG